MNIFISQEMYLKIVIEKKGNVKGTLKYTYICLKQFQEYRQDMVSFVTYIFPVLKKLLGYKYKLSSGQYYRCSLHITHQLMDKDLSKLKRNILQTNRNI